MIAKYAGKCDLTATAIIAGQTEIAKFGNATVLAEYATQEAIDTYFVTKTAEVAAIATETTQLRGRENRMLADFTESLQSRRTSKFSVLKADGEWVRNEIAGMTRRLEAQRQKA